MTCFGYGSFHTRTVRVIFRRDDGTTDDRVSRSTAGDRHRNDVCAEGGQVAVREQQGLEEQGDGGG
jgi:hypothetical protein